MLTRQLIADSCQAITIRLDNTLARGLPLMLSWQPNRACYDLSPLSKNLQRFEVDSETRAREAFARPNLIASDIRGCSAQQCRKTMEVGRRPPMPSIE
jgi:hypothetical protein